MAEYINAISASEPADRNRLMAFGTTTINLDIDRNRKVDDWRVTSKHDRFHMAARAIEDACMTDHDSVEQTVYFRMFMY